MASRLPEHPLDVVCMVKRHASDPNLAQEVLLACPYCRLERLTPLPTTLVPRKLVPIERKRKWVELANFVLRQRCKLDCQRTARFLLDLVNDPPPPSMVPLPWLERIEDACVGVPSLPDVLDRLAPVMKFKATIRR